MSAWSPFDSLFDRLTMTISQRRYAKSFADINLYGSSRNVFRFSARKKKKDSFVASVLGISKGKDTLALHPSREMARVSHGPQWNIDFAEEMLNRLSKREKWNRYIQMHLENRSRRKICRTVFIPGEPLPLHCGKLIISKLVKEYSVLSPAIQYEAYPLPCSKSDFDLT